MLVFLTGGTKVWVRYLCHVAYMDIYLEVWHIPEKKIQINEIFTPHHNGSRPHLAHEVKVCKKANKWFTLLL